MKKRIRLFLCLALCLALTVPALAWEGDANLNLAGGIEVGVGFPGQSGNGEREAQGQA